jgi:hypothetical protein
VVRRCGGGGDLNQQAGLAALMSEVGLDLPSAAATKSGAIIN